MNRILIIGYGIQGKKRHNINSDEVVGIVDPIQVEADYTDLFKVPLNVYDVAYVCCPDGDKEQIIKYLVENKKHILIEKPLYPINFSFLKKIDKISRDNKTVIYVAYNHRFEPNILDIKDVIDNNKIGKIYYIHFFYGNGTSQDILKSKWRNQEKNGIFQDLGCHILDLIDFFKIDVDIQSLNKVISYSFETKSYDYGQFVIDGKIKICVHLSNLSWKNSFYIDCIGEKGSVHATSLCKWGEAKSVFRQRVLPSGVPIETENNYSNKDPTWIKESNYFKALINKNVSGIDKKEFKILEILDKIKLC
jgi:predicted dehydrogenase